MRRLICVVVSHHICGHVLEQPQETNTGRYSDYHHPHLTDKETILAGILTMKEALDVTGGCSVRLWSYPPPIEDWGLSTLDFEHPEGRAIFYFSL